MREELIRDGYRNLKRQKSCPEEKNLVSVGIKRAGAKPSVDPFFKLGLAKNFSGQNDTHISVAVIRFR